MNIYYVYAYDYHICLTVYTSHTRQNYHLLVKYTTESVVEIIEKGIMYIPGTLYLTVYNMTIPYPPEHADELGTAILFDYLPCL